MEYWVPRWGYYQALGVRIFDRQGNAAQQENRYVDHPGLCDNGDRVSSSQTTQSWDLALLSPPHRLGILGRPYTSKSEQAVLLLVVLGRRYGILCHMSHTPTS